jgi:hypothetical protein
VHSSEQPLAEAITANIRAQRSRAKLNQGSVARRMQALGFRWHYQTVGAIERGERQISADELAWLAICLETTPAVLLQPVTDAITSPGGVAVAAQRLSLNDDSVRFNGDEPVVTASAVRPPEARRGEFEELARNLAEVTRELRSAARREPDDDQQRHSTYEPGEDAVDIPPRRPRKVEDQR